MEDRERTKTEELFNGEVLDQDDSIEEALKEVRYR